MWPYLTGNANVVPTVANGMVYVASYRQLAIFGLTSQVPGTKAQLQRPAAVSGLQAADAQFWGKVKSIRDTRLVLVLRTGKLLLVDLGDAFTAGTSIEPRVGEYVVVNGRINQNSVMEARFVRRAKGPKSWGVDSRG
jgi:hypothetical protein